MIAPAFRPQLCLLMALLLLPAFPVFGAAQADPTNILIVNSFRGTVAPYQDLSFAFQSALVRNLGNPVEFYEVAVDADRFPDPPMQASQAEFLQKRFAARRLDLIVATGAPAAQFVARYRETAFAEIPVFYLGVDPRFLNSESNRKNATFLWQDVSPAAWVEDILQIAPDTTNILFLMGASRFERAWADIERRELGSSYKGVTLTFLIGASLDQVEKRVSALPAHSFIHFGLFIRDSLGVSYGSNEVFRRLRAAANAPIYGVFQSHMGLGIVGGRLYQNLSIAAPGAQIAARILRGEPAGSIPALIWPTPAPVYDWRELRRWGIKESRLPTGSTILFREPTFWERYRWYIAGVASFCLIETLLIIGLLMNLRRRRLVELSLRQSELNYRKLHESMMDAFVSVDMSGRIRDFNPAYQQMLGYAADELRQLTYEQITPARWRDIEARIVQDQVLSVGYSDVYEKEYRRKDGTVFPVELRTSLLRDESGEPYAMWAIVRDITEHRRASEALRESEERFRQVAETVSDFVWEVDADGLYKYTSPSVEKILGYTPGELVGKMHFYDLFVPDVRQQLKAAALEAFATRQVFHAFPNSNVSKSGNIVYMETSGVPILDEAGRLLGYRGADSDVSDRRRAEMETQQLRQELAFWSRVATVGELTASIAHELNQPLSAILSNAQTALRLMQREAPDLKELQEIFTDIVADDQRAAEVIRSMRSMLTKGGGERGRVSLNSLITGIVPIIRNDALMKKITVVLDLGSPMPPVEGSRIQLQQMILNLVINAFEAMEATDRPRELVLRTRQADGEIVLDVVDSGTGIPTEKLTSIFEPFFTTKKTGLGMGLSLSHSIVTAHNGHLWAENNPKTGATFHVALPGYLEPVVQSGNMQCAAESDTSAENTPL